MYFSDQGPGDIIVYLIRWANKSYATEAARSFYQNQRRAGQALDIPLTLNNTARMTHSPSENSVILIFSAGTVMAYLDLTLVAGVEPKSLGALAAILGVTQLDKLELAGYK